MALFRSSDFKGVEELWGNRVFGYILIAIAFALGIAAWVQPPPSGYAITVMAVIAGVMTLRPDMGSREKFLWFAILLLYTAVEIRAIKADRLEQDAKFSEEIKMITGGDSFCYLDVLGSPELTGVNLIVLFQGKYPLYDVAVRIGDAKYTRETKDVFHATLDERKIGNIGSPGASMGKVYGPVAFKVAGDTQELNIFFDGRNGFWSELIRMRKENGKWVRAKVVYGTLDLKRFPKGARVLEQIDKEFPTEALSSDQDWTNVQKLPKAY
jgi:hypothetical protein